MAAVADASSDDGGACCAAGGAKSSASAAVCCAVALVTSDPATPLGVVAAVGDARIGTAGMPAAVAACGGAGTATAAAGGLGGGSACCLAGLSLAGFDAVVDAAGGRTALEGKTTLWLKESLVLPATRDSRVAYTALLPAATHGRATHFVSHAYDYTFLKAVDALRAWEARQPAGGGPFFYYFDLLVVNQHAQAEKVAFETLRDEFGGGVRGTGHTLLFLEWGTDARMAPVALTRAWCVFEVFVTLASGARFEIVFAPADSLRFEAALKGNFAELAHRSCVINAETCAAREEADRDNIHQAIRHGPGFLRVNQVLVEALQRWMVETGRRALDSITDPSKRATSSLYSGLARLLREQGKLEDAEPLCVEALAGCRRVLGDSHPSTLAAISNLASLLSARGKHSSAESLYVEALTGRRLVLGDNHVSTLASINNLATLLADQGRLEDAEPLFVEALASRRRELGDTHPHTLTSINSLATLRQAQGKFSDAEALFMEALASRRRVLGDSHVDTLRSTSQLGSLLKAQGKLAAAEAPYAEALAGRRRVLGDSHPSTLTSVNNLAALRHSQGKLAEAEALFMEALAGRRRVLGASHADTINTTSQLAAVLTAQGKLAEAEAMVLGAAEGRSE